MEKFIVYAIKSLVDNRLYVGFTNSFERRIKEHNDGKTRSTKAYRPWVVVFTEMVTCREEARKREKFLKSGCGKEFLKRNLQQNSAL